MHHAIGFLHDSRYLTTIDPNFYWKNEPENIEVFMEKELYLPVSGAFGGEQVAAFRSYLTSMMDPLIQKMNT